jgi:ProP effector
VRLEPAPFLPATVLRPDIAEPAARAGTPINAPGHALAEKSEGIAAMNDGVTKVKAAISELVAAFPAAFTLDPMLVRPFKLGIKDDLYLQSDLSHRRITAALRAYCNSVHYLQATTEGAVRIDLAGGAAGTVTATEAHHAKEGLAALPKARIKGASSPSAPKAPKTGRTDCQRETSLDVGQEAPSVHCPVDCTWCRHAILAQSGNEGDRLPMTVWLKIHQPLAACATAVKPHHLGVGGSLVDEHQPGRIKQTLFAHPASACPRYVRTLLLRRAQAFF